MEKGDMWVNIIGTNRYQVLNNFKNMNGVSRYNELKLNVIDRLQTTDDKDRILSVFDEEYAKMK